MYYENLKCKNFGSKRKTADPECGAKINRVKDLLTAALWIRI
jgi:hypothetical protein